MAVGEAPAHRAGRGVERVEAMVVGTDVHRPSPHRRGAVNEAARPSRPEQPPAAGAERVDEPVGRAHEHTAVRIGGGRVEASATGQAPFRTRRPAELASAGIERVDVAIVRACVDNSARESSALLCPLRPRRPLRSSSEPGASGCLRRTRGDPRSRRRRARARGAATTRSLLRGTATEPRRCAHSARPACRSRRGRGARTAPGP